MAVLERPSRVSLFAEGCVASPAAPGMLAKKTKEWRAGEVLWRMSGVGVDEFLPGVTALGVGFAGGWWSSVPELYCIGRYGHHKLDVQPPGPVTTSTYYLAYGL